MTLSPTLGSNYTTLFRLHGVGSQQGMRLPAFLPGAALLPSFPRDAFSRFEPGRGSSFIAPYLAYPVLPESLLKGDGPMRGALGDSVTGGEGRHGHQPGSGERVAELR